MCDIVMCPLNSNFLTVLGNVSLQVVDVRVDAAHYVIPLGDTLTKENIKDAPSCYFLHSLSSALRASFARRQGYCHIPSDLPHKPHPLDLPFEAPLPSLDRPHPFIR